MIITDMCNMYCTGLKEMCSPSIVLVSDTLYLLLLSVWVKLLCTLFNAHWGSHSQVQDITLDEAASVRLEQCLSKICILILDDSCHKERSITG